MTSYTLTTLARGGTYREMRIKTRVVAILRKEAGEIRASCPDGWFIATGTDWGDAARNVLAAKPDLDAVMVGKSTRS